MTTRRQLEERISQARLDLAEIETQLADGELDPATAAELRRRYEEEIARAGAAGQALPEAAPATGPAMRRVVAGTLLMTAAVIAIVFLVARAIDDRAPGEFATGGIEGRDLSEVSTAEMEQVVTDFPEVVGMRLALAGRYFDAGQFSEALPHYLTVLEQDAANPEANAMVGWMTYLSDPEQSPTAVAFLERSLQAAPGYAQAQFFLANVLLYGLDDPAGALPLLEELRSTADLSDDVAATIDRMVADAGGER